MNVIFVGATGATLEKGRVLLCPDTQRACELAYHLAFANPDQGNILITAGKTRIPWDGTRQSMKKEIIQKIMNYVLRRPLTPKDGAEIWMANHMSQHILQLSEGQFVPITRCATEFNTSGEMKELATFCRDSAESVRKITLVVKTSQEKRMKYLAQCWLYIFGLGRVEVTTETFGSVRKNWRLYEWLAFRKDVRHMKKVFRQKGIECVPAHLTAAAA